MGKKLSILVMILIIGVYFLGMDVQSSADQSSATADKMVLESPEGFDLITIHNEGYEKFVKGPVNFYHMRHIREYKVNCWECHHVYTDEKKNIWSPWAETDKCMACHDPVEKIDGVMKLQTAYHLNCRTCHEERDIYKGEAGAYSKCDRCHVQEITIENNLYPEDKMGPVMFNHRRHEKIYSNSESEGIACGECHHDFVNGENIWTEWDLVKRCGTADCHDPIEKKGEKQEELRTAYHNRCKVCHKDLTEAGETEVAPYIKCSGCHLYTK